MPKFIRLFGAALCLGAASGGAAGFEVVPGDKNDPSSPAKIDKVILPGVGGGDAKSGANGYLARVSNGAPHYRVFGPKGGNPCGKRVKTSETAAANRCRWATNGGPFNMKTGDCDEGVAVINGSLAGTGGWNAPMFGTTASGNYVIGTLNETVVNTMDINWAIPGFYWLVRNGVSVAGNGTYKAPRTAVGVNKEGQLLLLEVDGCEPQTGCKYKYGKTDHDMAALLIEQGAYHAINLDGGGSSTTVENGTVIDRPTDTDHWAVKKERAVTTITCVL